MSEYKEGQYAAVFYEDNSTGDHDRCYAIAIWCKHFNDAPSWRSYETMQEIVGPYEGDKILMIWLLRPVNDTARIIHKNLCGHMGD